MQEGQRGTASKLPHGIVERDGRIRTGAGIRDYGKP